MTIQNLTRNEKAYIVWRFIFELHSDDRFIIAQKPLKHILKLLRSSDLFPYLENININEFVEFSKDVITAEPEELALILKGIKDVDPNLKVKIKEVIDNA